MTLEEFATRGMKAQTEVDKLCHANGSQTSKDAAKKMVESGALSRQEKEVLFVIQNWYFGRDFTTKDIARKMLPMPYYKAYDICRKRFSGLEDKGKIDVVWEALKIKRRDNCRVWRLL